jgi:hypothetical protein
LHAGVSKVDLHSVFVNKADRWFEIYGAALDHTIAEHSAQLEHVCGSCGLRGSDAVQVPSRQSRTPHLEVDALCVVQQLLRLSAARICEQGFG